MRRDRMSEYCDSRSLEEKRLDPAWVTQELQKMSREELRAYRNILGFSLSPRALLVGNRDQLRLHLDIVEAILKSPES